MALWDERQSGEGPKAWAAFVIYRDLGSAERSITKAWRRSKNKETGESGRWEEWARKFKWVERAAAYDKHLDDQARSEVERQLVKLARRQAELQIPLQAKIEKRLEKTEAILDKFDSVPVTDVTRSEENQITVKEGVIEVKTVKTKVRGLSASAYARLNREYRETAKQAVNGLRRESGSGGFLSSEDDGIKELAKAIRESPE